MLREYFIVYQTLRDSDSFSAWGLIFRDVSLTTAAHCKVAHRQHELDPQLYSISVSSFPLGCRSRLYQRWEQLESDPCDY